MQLQKKSIFIITTQAITINIFYEAIIQKLKKNYKVVLVCRDTEKLKYKGFEKIKILFPISYFDIINLKTIFICISQIRKISINKESIFLINTPVASIIFRIINYFKNLKIIYFVHGYRFHRKNKKISEYLFLIIEYLLSKKTKHYININNQDYRFTKNTLKKDTILINGVGVDIPKKNNKKKKFIDRACIISAYKKEKGYEAIFNQINEIKKQLPQLKIDCYGYGSKKVYENKYNLHNYKNIKLYNFKKNLHELIPKYDFLIHPSYREGLPVSVIQCLSFGLPVIGRNIRGVNDLVKHKFNGYLFNNDDQIIKMIKLLMLNKNYNKFSFNSKKKITKNYSKKYIANKIEQYLKEIY